jgi:predicted ATP-grasp superfamily ATP-dependent carboligase
MLQEYIAGDSYAAVFAGAETGATLLGVTRQLVGVDVFHAPPFHYCGSVGPWTLAPRTMASIRRLGDVLARAFELRGLFGIDFVLADDVPWPVDINPRYPASVEVLEHALGVSAFFGVRWLDTALDSSHRTPKIVGKGILYARAPVIFPTEGPWCETLDSPWTADALPRFADIPHAGEVIRAGRPILTFFAEATSLAGCVAALEQTADMLDGCLCGAKP